MWPALRWFVAPSLEHANLALFCLVCPGGDRNGTIYLEAQKQKLNEVCGGCENTSEEANMST